MQKNLFYFILIMMFSLQLGYSQNRDLFWSEGTKFTSDIEKWDRTSLPSSFQLYELDLNGLYNVLLNAPNRKQSKNVNGVQVGFPYDGKVQVFEVYKAPVLAAELQDRLTNVSSYIGRLVSNRNVVIRFSMSLKGFNAVILNGANGTQYIDSYTRDNNFCISYLKSNIPPQEAIVCLNADDEESELSFGSRSAEYAQRNVDDGALREFRLALACTQEYATFHVSQLGLATATDEAKKDGILSVMNDIMTRVNAVYENELSVTMVIVPNNSNVVFLQDTFLSNNDISALINQSQTFIDLFVGSANYDIGHMLSTSGSGLAQLFSPCTNNKARAVSGGLGGAPQGVVFENTMMHEMGHQYGAFHTYNANNCAGPATTSSAYEPGGGTTIMSYAGICGSSANIQPVADNYFHQNSIDQMWFNLTNGNSTCANQIITNNSTPTADAGADYTIPIGTPYKLVGLGTDSDGIETLTYTWEQFDLGPSVAVPNNFTTSGPIVRSFPPNTNNTRYVPRLQDYVNNVNVSTSWEKLVLINRNINYSLAVRDNDLAGGQLAVDFMVITVNELGGSFSVISQDESGIVYSGGSSQTVSWDLGSTDGAPFNVDFVNILLSTDGGLTFDTVLLSNTPNDGTQEVIMPNINSSSCRIMVEAVGNIFYNINSTNFQIQENLSLEDESTITDLSIFPNPSKGKFSLRFNSNSSASQIINIEVYDISGRVVYKGDFVKHNSMFDETLNLNTIQSGVYIVNVKEGNTITSRKLVIE